MTPHNHRKSLTASLTDEAKLTHLYQCPYCGSGVDLTANIIGPCVNGCTEPSTLSSIPSMEDFQRPLKLYLVHKNHLRVVETPVTSYECSGNTGLLAHVKLIGIPLLVWPVRFSPYYYVATSYDEACRIVREKQSVCLPWM